VKGPRGIGESITHPPASGKKRRILFMNEDDRIKDLERQAGNTRRLMDRLNMAYYGMTWDELVKTLGKDGWNNDRNTECS
jgi:hypothetical protein